MSEEKKVETKNESTESTKTYTEEQFKGLLADKQAEVKKRQQLEQQLAEVKAEKEQGKPQPSGEKEGGSEDDKPMTVGRFKKMMAEEKKAQTEADFALRDARSREAALTEYTAESKGEGLDFETVITEGAKSLTEGDLLAIRKAKEPAKEKYRRCVMLTPELNERAEAFRNSGLLEKIKLTGRVPATGSAEVTAAAEDVSKMSDEELDKLAESL